MTPAGTFAGASSAGRAGDESPPEAHPGPRLAAEGWPPSAWTPMLTLTAVWER